MAKAKGPAAYSGEFKADRWALGLPKSRREIEAIHRAKKRLALARAQRSKFLAKRVAGIDPRRIDDPHEWGKIPVLTKDELRKLSTEEFYRDFCIEGFEKAVEFWRSGGATGRPLFYPRTAEDSAQGLVTFERGWSRAVPQKGCRRDRPTIPQSAKISNTI